jgi:hypothetical protein
MALYAGSAEKYFLGGSTSSFHNNRGHSQLNSNRGRYSRGRVRGINVSSNKPQCQICQKWGHLASHCYHRFDICYSGDSPSDSSSQHQALVAAPHECWFLDSGATTYVTSDINCLSSSQSYTGIDTVHMGNGTCFCTSLTLVQQFFQLLLSLLLLTNVLHVPSIIKKLLSIQQSTKDNDVIVEFTSDSYFIKERHTKRTILIRTLTNGVYALDTGVYSPAAVHHALHTSHLFAGDMTVTNFSKLNPRFCKVYSTKP